MVFCWVFRVGVNQHLPLRPKKAACRGFSSEAASVCSVRMLAFGIGLGLAAPTPLGRMESTEVSDFTSDYSQLQVLQTAAPASDMHQVAAPSDITDDTEHSKEATSDLLKAAKKAEHEGRKASKDAEKAEAREQLKAQKEREHALQIAQSDEEKRNAEARKAEARSAAEEAQPLVRSSADDAKSGVNTAQEARKAVKEAERAKLKEQKEKERAAQKDANKLERERLNADAREAQKRLADSQRQVGVDSPAGEAAPTSRREAVPTEEGSKLDERDAMKAAARAQRDAEKSAAKAQNDEQKANAKAQNAAERARAKEQTEQLKVDNEKQRFREAAGRYERRRHLRSYEVAHSLTQSPTHSLAHTHTHTHTHTHAPTGTRRRQDHRANPNPEPSP
jgi:hypothetical protein